jgi:hypothetical protein
MLSDCDNSTQSLAEAIALKVHTACPAGAANYSSPSVRNESAPPRLTIT